MFIVGFVFILGLIVGSFINMALARYNTGLSFNKRSFCFSCGHMLSWYDLIPLVSFIMQSRKCRYCQSKISFQYPVVELITGVLFVFIFFKLDPSFSVYYLLLTTYYCGTRRNHLRQINRRARGPHRRSIPARGAPQKNSLVCRECCTAHDHCDRHSRTTCKR